MSIKKIEYYESDNFNPYLNLSFEEKLLNQYEDGTLIFYLWQNTDCVVIGKNQCAKEQCHLDLMEKEHVKLARRSSGGGAVFHDLGNLNFTFITSSEDFDIKKNLQVIRVGLRAFGIESYFSGRNDLLVDEFKISGQAYLKTKGACLHHGTLLVNTNLHNLGRYLKTDDDKLKAHGVKSHAQRVRNLSDFVSGISIDQIKASLKKAVISVFDCELVKKEVIENELFRKYYSKEWLFRLNKLGEQITKRFEYGLIDINLEIDNEIINRVSVNSDMMDVDIIEEIKACFINKTFNHSLLGFLSLSNKQIENDIKAMLEERLCTT
jgi:lipoate-protein ligase A